MTVDYTLAKDGDSLERRFWPFLSKLWPNYEVVWQRFIAPMTMRVYDRGDISLRPEIDRRLEEMCMAHYSIFYHLASTYESLRWLEKDRRLPHHYDDTFFHLSAATEMVERFLVALRKVQYHVEGQEPLGSLTVDELMEMARVFHQKHYQKAYYDYVQGGRAVNIRLHAVRDLIDPVLVRSGSQDIAKELWKTADSIRQYRNALTHNPLIPKLIGEQNVVYLPKQNALRDYDLWSAAFFGQGVESDYVPGLALVGEFLAEFESRLNALWDRLIALLTEWSKTEKYAEMEPPIVEPGDSSERKPPTEPTAIWRRPTGGSPFRPSGTSVVSDIPGWPEGDE